jgi:hypothetical protein
MIVFRATYTEKSSIERIEYTVVQHILWWDFEAYWLWHVATQIIYESNFKPLMLIQIICITM